jgi:hypothetical protein
MCKSCAEMAGILILSCRPKPVWSRTISPRQQTARASIGRDQNTTPITASVGIISTRHGVLISTHPPKITGLPLGSRNNAQLNFHRVPIWVSVLSSSSWDLRPVLGDTILSQRHM